MADPLKDRAKADRKVLDAMVRCIPAKWSRVVMHLAIVPGPVPGSEAVSVALVGNGGAETCKASDSLFQAVWELSQLARRLGTPWKTTTLIAERSNNGWAIDGERVSEARPQTIKGVAEATAAADGKSGAGQAGNPGAASPEAADSA